MLIYGDTGTGKTRLSASSQKVPQMAPALLLDFDRGTGSVDWPIKQISVVDFKQITPAINLAASGKFKTVILDTLTELYRFLLGESSRVRRLKRPESDPDIAEQADYLRAHEWMRRILRMLRDAPVHFIATAQRGVDYDPVTQEPKGSGPMISGRLNREVGAFFALVGCLEVSRESVVELHTEVLYQHLTKDREAKIPGVMDSPTMQELYDFYFPSKGGARRNK
jgi:hypothetical protein